MPLYNAQFGQGAGPVIINTIACTSSAQNISQCTITTPSSCSHSNDAGLRCEGLYSTQKNTVTSIGDLNLKFKICYTESCSVEGSIRLLGGNSQREGTVEVCQNRVWGTVCDDQWGTPDAAVVCRQLGFPFDCKCISC